MAEKRKAGLHKKISSIFDGVPVPRNDTAGTIPDQPQYAPSRKSFAQTGSSSAHDRTADASKKSAEHFSPWQVKKLLTPPPGVSARRQKTMVLLLPILAVILIFTISRIFRSSQVKKPVKAPVISSVNNNVRPDQVEDNTVIDEAAKIEWNRPASLPTTLPDPMYVKIAEPEPSPEEVAAQAAVFVVKSILHSKNRRSSIVGLKQANKASIFEEKIVHEGERFFDATVIKINADSVEFEKNGERLLVHK